MSILSKITKKNQALISKTAKEVSNSKLGQLAFDHSIQANIVINSNERIIMANNAACKLLGYSQEELLTKNQADIFVVNESAFKEMLGQRTAKGHSKAYVTAIHKKGKQIPCEITSSLFIGEHNFEKSVFTLEDVSLRIRHQKNIDAKKEKIVAYNITLAKTKQRNIDVEKEKIVAYNITLAKTKQRNIDTEKKKIVAYNITVAKTKQRNIDAEKKKIVAYNITVAKTKQRNIDTKKENIAAYNITRAETRQRNIDIKKEKMVSDNIELAQSNADAKLKDFMLGFNSSTDVLYDSNLLSNQVIISDGYHKEFGYKIVGNMTPTADWISHIHPDDREEVLKHFNRMLASKDMNWKYNYRLLKADHSVANVMSNAIILRDAKGKAYRIIGSMHDISKQITLEQKLDREIKLKEKQIQEAVEEAKDAERLDLGKELHDNVNQLLGASKLYLEMAKRGGKESEKYFSRSSEYTLTAIEEIRKISKGLTTDIISTIGLCKAIENLALDTMDVHPVKIEINCALDSFIENSVTDKFDLNIFRIIQEQLNNILKHAKARKVHINLSQNKKSIILLISDDGIGFDTTIKRKGIGLDNIKSRATMNNGTAEFVSKPGKGCVLTVTFPVNEASLN
ncbi:MAG: PAS domain S-box protein [Ginsengibacter sp.]